MDSLKEMAANRTARNGLSEKKPTGNGQPVPVGFESPSQFSREYTRQFGAPPLRDIKQLHQTVHPEGTA